MQVVPKTLDLGRSSPALPGTWFSGDIRTGMSAYKGRVPCHESPRSHTFAREQRLPLGSSEGQPSAIRRHGEGANSWGHSGREGKRRGQKGHTCIDQAAIKPPQKSLSAPLNVGQRPPFRVEKEVHRRPSASMQPVKKTQRGHLRPDVPRGLSCQPTKPILSRQRVRALQIQFNTGRQGGFRLIEGRTISGDIKIGANRVPPITTLSGITSQVHLRFPTPIRNSKTGGQSTISLPHLLEPLLLPAPAGDC